MEDNKYNELDKLFRSRLNNPTEDDGSWNVPSNDVFEAAMDEVNGGDSRRRFMVIFWLSLLGLLLVLGLIYWNISTLNRIDRKMDKMIASQEQEQISTSESSPAHNQSSAQVNKVASETEIKAPSHSANTNPTAQNARHENNEKAGNSSAQTGSFRQAQTSIVPARYSEAKPEPAANKTSLINVSDSLLPTWELLPKAITGFPLFFDPLPYSIADKQPDHFFPDSVPENMVSDILFSVGPSISSLKMISDEELPGGLTKYDKWYTGYHVQISFAKELNKKMSAMYGLQYQRFSNQSEYRAEHSYVKANENTNNAGELEYSTNLELLTPIGLHNEDMLVPLGNNSIDDQEEIVHITDMKNRFDVAGLHVGLRYNLIQSGVMSFYVNGSVAANYFLSVNEQLSTKVYYEGRMLDEFKFDHRTKGQLDNLFLQGSFGLGLDRQITSRLSLGMNIQGSSSINSIQKPGPVKLHLRQAGALLNVGYRF